MNNTTISDQRSLIHDLRAVWQFYSQAITKYQVHPPFAYDFVQAVVEDKRWFYAFDDIALVRQKMLQSDASIEITDYGAGPGGAAGSKNGPTTRMSTVQQVAGSAGSSTQQGKRLFRLIDWLKPRNLLELGGSLGLGTLYMAASAGPGANILSLEGCAACADIARLNLDTLRLNHAKVVTGPFSETLTAALQKLGQVDFVFLDGNHRFQPTIDYFETCLAFAHDHTVFVFDDVHWSPGMDAAWAQIKAHPRVTLTIDCWDFACVFFNPDFRQKQHLRIVPAIWKPWRFFL